MYKAYKMANSFELKYSGHVDNMIPVFKYRSKDTGLTVVVAQVGGPLVNGYFCLGEFDKSVTAAFVCFIV